MTTRNVAERLGVSYQTVIKLLRRREIGYLRIGKRYVITEADLNAFLARARVPALGSANETQSHTQSGGLKP